MEENVKDKLKNRLKNLHKKIYDEYPELMTQSSDKRTSFFEQVKAYYEVKGIESQTRRDWVIVLLAIVNLILVGFLTFK